MLFRHTRSESPIRDVRTLSEALDLTDGFVLLFGSAVSRADPPGLPMAAEVLKGVFLSISKVLSKGCYAERVAAAYATSLYAGLHRNIVTTTKFEEFLGIIQLSTNREKLNDLLCILYLCRSNELGLNHNAISWLLQTKRCTDCLTTNFDNALENVPATRVYIHTHFHEYTVDSGALKVLKLHGSVTDDSCVATNRALFEQADGNTYSFLPSFLRNRKVLVVGYSGTGDVDISPHLSLAVREGAKFYWCAKEIHRPIPHYAKRRVVCDLWSSNGNENLLLGLAEQSGWTSDTDHRGKHHWLADLETWCSSVAPCELVDIVTRTFQTTPSWAVVHLMTLHPYTMGSGNPSITKGRACLQRSAYGPAEAIFRDVLSTSEAGSSDQVTARKYLGFVQWRTGKFVEALNFFFCFCYKETIKIR